MGKRREAPECPHPYDELSVVSNVSSRGGSGEIRVSCQKCGKGLPGNGGLVLFVIGMRDEMRSLRRAVRNLGGDLVDPALGAKKRGKRKFTDVKDTCPHYLGWLDVADDKSSVRGHRVSNTVKCRNCQTTWGDHTALLMVMKREINAMWLEVLRLGGKRTYQ